MRGISILFVLLFVSLGLLACKHANDDKHPASSQDTASTTGSGAGSGVSKPRAEQVTPPFDVKSSPADATKTASGLIYKKLATSEAGAPIKRNDTVLINLTSWRQSTGETFFTNRQRGQPMPLNLSQSAPGFVEAMQLLRKGEKAMLWVPPAIGYKAPPTEGTPETLVYEVEVVDITPAPAIPDNTAKPPDNAEALPLGIKRVAVRPGTGKDKVRMADTATFNYTAWDAEGRMVDTTETRKRAVTAPAFKQTRAMEAMLVTMTAGERARFWVDAEKMATGGKSVGGVEHGVLCYEVEVLQIAKAKQEPPPAPPDVAKPPEGAKRTPKGVFYRLLASHPKGAEHPSASSIVKVNYTGWTTDGRMFDSSLIKGEPAQFGLVSVVPGWTEGIPMMVVGDHMRFWIPEELAYKGAPGKPAGMLVFDVELVEIVPPSSH